MPDPTKPSAMAKSFIYNRLRHFLRRLTGLIPALVALFVLPDPTSAQQFTGQLYGDLYVWSTDSTDVVQPYLGLRSQLNLFNFQSGQNLAFVSNFRWSDNLSGDTSTTTRFFIYESYLRFKCRPRRLAGNAGRQFVYSAAGSALIDGGRLRVGPFARTTLELFGGSEVSRIDPESVRSLSEYMILGGRLAHTARFPVSVGLNWFMRRSDDFVSYHRLSLDASYSPYRWQFYGRVGYNLVALELAEAIGRIGRAAGKWYFSGEFLYREPSVNINSIFALINYEQYKQTRLEVRRKVWQTFSLFTQTDITFFKDDQAIAGSVGLSNGLFSLAWVHQSGAFGDNDGISGFANVTIADQWDVYAHARLTQYVVQEEQEDRSDAYSAALGVSRSLGRGFNGRTEIQVLRNAVSESDVRLYLRLSKNFSIGTEQQ